MVTKSTKNVSSNDVINNLKTLLSNVAPVIDINNIEEQYIETPLSVINRHLSGGFLSGKINVLAGLPHTGKSTIAIQAAKYLLDNHDEAVLVYFDSENAMRKKRMEALGLDINRTIYMAYDLTLETVFATIDTLIEYKEKNNLQHVPYMCIWDTLAFTPSEALLQTSEFQNTDEMVYAKLLKKFIVSYAGLLNKYNIQLLILNQLRTKTGSLNKFQQTYDIDIEGMRYNMPGGSILKFAAFQLMIFTNTSSFIEKKRREERDIDVDDSKFKRLTTVKATILKNKSGDTLIEEDIVFNKKTGFSNLWTSFLFLEKHGYIKRSGAYYSLPNYETKFFIKGLEEKYETDEGFKKAFDECVVNYIFPGDLRD